MTARQWRIALVVAIWLGLIDGGAAFIEGLGAFFVVLQAGAGAFQVLSVFGVVAVVDWVFGLGDDMKVAARVFGGIKEDR